MKRAGNLFEILISDDNLEFAIHEVNKTHHWKPGHVPNPCTAWVEETKSERVQELRDILVKGFIPKKPYISKRYDRSAQKWRSISEPEQWPDQYVHHALIQVLQPVMMRGMDYYCCGSIRGRGTHYAAKAIKHWMNSDPIGTKYCFTGDIRHFYDSLTPEVVMNRMKHLVKDYRVLDLIERVISDGVMIGAYISQWFANTVLQPLDTMIRQSGLCIHYVRYMDNFTIFGSSKQKLHDLKEMVSNWLKEHSLRLKDDWQVYHVIQNEVKTTLHQPRKGVSRPVERMPDAVGYRYGRKFSVPGKRTLLRLKRRITKYYNLKRRHKRIPSKLASGLLSQIGILKHCNNYNLYAMLFRGKRLQKELKQIVRYSQKKETLTWNMYLEQRKILKSLKPKAGSIPT